MRSVLWILAIVATATWACSTSDTKLTCTDDSDCFEQYRCDPVHQVCLRACDGTDAGCLASQYCDVTDDSVTPVEGVCRDGEAPTGDADPGDPNPGD